MLHNSCGAHNPQAPCMKGGKCSKKFPKEFVDKTFIATKLEYFILKINNISLIISLSYLKSGYVIYRRRQDNKMIVKGEIQYDNRSVVPYNLFFTTKYNCHINLEICNSIQAVKYLYKYVYKGSDQVSMQMQQSDAILKNQIVPPKSTNIAKNEIKNFTDARYVSASEACWRIYNFKNSSQYPSTVPLDVDLENDQSCIYDSTLQYTTNEERQKLELNGKTQLTEYFKLNCTDLFANSLLYHEIPKHYTWNNKLKKWTKRAKNK